MFGTRKLMIASVFVSLDIGTEANERFYQAIELEFQNLLRKRQVHID